MKKTQENEQKYPRNCYYSLKQLFFCGIESMSFFADSGLT